MAKQFDEELEEAGWYEDARIYRGASAEQLLQNVFGRAQLDAGLVLQVQAFHAVMLKTAQAQERGQAAIDGRLADHLAYIREVNQAKRARVEPAPVEPQRQAWSPRWSSSRTFRRTRVKEDLAATGREVFPNSSGSAGPSAE